MQTPFGLFGKKILITGASSGIGRSIAIECNKLGAEVFITGRNKHELDITFTRLVSTVGCDFFYGDLTLEDVQNKLVDLLPVLDGIVHCAGISEPKPFRFVNEEYVRKVFEINFFSPLFITKKIIASKKLNNSSSIVFISSMVGNNCSFVGSSLYGATKSAVSGFIKGLALELAVKKIRVNSVLPGMIMTELLSSSSLSTDDLSEDEKKYPLKRYGKPNEVAYAVIYLLSDASCWVTGSELLIDGGFTLN
ncbi:MAG: hypothetical protein QG594_238 [Bacteroidota bacterium]|nr:hypothetical protein [Bacteroidota bacterium]